MTIDITCCSTSNFNRIHPHRHRTWKKDQNHLSLLIGLLDTFIFIQELIFCLEKNVCVCVPKLSRAQKIG